MRRIRFGTLSGFVGALALAGLAFVSASGAHAQTVSDIELVTLGKRHLEQRDWVHAAMYLYAYVQRDPEYMRSDPGHAGQVRNALMFAETQASETITRLRNQVAELRRASPSGDVAAHVSGLTLEPAPPPLDVPMVHATVIPPSYPIVCRGGGDLRLHWNPYPHIQGWANAMMVSFRRAGQAAGHTWNGLRPGECAWIDRPIRSDEPNRICHKIDPAKFSFDWTPASGRIHGIATAAPPYLHNLGNPDEFSVFEVYNDRELRCLVVTSLK